MDIFKIFINLLFPTDKNTLIYNKISTKELEKLAKRNYSKTKLKCLAPFPYNKKLIKKAIYLGKYNSHIKALKLLGKILSPHLIEEIANKRMFGEFEKIIVIPIPLHPKRLCERGFNQNELIANSLIATIADNNITIKMNVLERIKNTKSQAKSKNKKERFENMKNAFNVKNPDDIYGKDVILLDDVITTGATLSSAKKVLEKAGARNVLCVAVAH